MEDLFEYAELVFEFVPTLKLLEYADSWLESPRTVTIWVLPVLLLMLPPLQAALAGLGLFLLWETFSPAMVSLALAKVFRVLERVYLQGIYYVFMMSVLAASGRMAAMWVGLAGFVLIRTGIVWFLTAFVTARIHRALFALPLPDQVLRAFIHRAALKYRVALPDLEGMERQILQTWTRKRGGRA
ncbi:hypothetical protein [Rhodocaloribacter sp.]